MQAFKGFQDYQNHHDHLILRPAMWERRRVIYFTCWGQAAHRAEVTRNPKNLEPSAAALALPRAQPDKWWRDRDHRKEGSVVEMERLHMSGHQRSDQKCIPERENQKTITKSKCRKEAIEKKTTCYHTKYFWAWWTPEGSKAKQSWHHIWKLYNVLQESKKSVFGEDTLPSLKNSLLGSSPLNKNQSFPFSKVIVFKKRLRNKKSPSTTEREIVPSSYRVPLFLK